MLIIFEGQDRCGKDTQIKKLINSKVFKYKYPIIIHSSGLKRDSDDESMVYNKEYYKQQMNVITNNKNNDFILNRSYFGEWVYGKLYRNYDAEYIWELENKFLKEYNDDVFLFVFVDEIDNLLKRDDGNSLSISKNNLIFEQSRFKEIYNNTKIEKKLFINIKDKTPDKIHDMLLSFIMVYV